MTDRSPTSEARDHAIRDALRQLPLTDPDAALRQRTLRDVRATLASRTKRSRRAGTGPLALALTLALVGLGLVLLDRGPDSSSRPIVEPHAGAVGAAMRDASDHGDQLARWLDLDADLARYLEGKLARGPRHPDVPHPPDPRSATDDRYTF